MNELSLDKVWFLMELGERQAHIENTDYLGMLENRLGVVDAWDLVNLFVISEFLCHLPDALVEDLENNFFEKVGAA